MQLTISRADDVVIIDGKALKVDCSDLSPIIHAIQWDGATGWIEFVPVNGAHVPNMKFADLTPYTYLIERWRLVLASQDAEGKEAKTRSLEEEIARIETKKQQIEDNRRAAEAARQANELHQREKQEIADKLATLEAKHAEQDARIKQLEAKLEAANAGSASAEELMPPA